MPSTHPGCQRLPESLRSGCDLALRTGCPETGCHCHLLTVKGMPCTWARGVPVGDSIKRRLPHPQELTVRCPPSAYTCPVGKDWIHQEQGGDGLDPPPPEPLQLSGAHGVKFAPRDPVDLSTSVCAGHGLCGHPTLSASTWAAPSPRACEPEGLPTPSAPGAGSDGWPRVVPLTRKLLRLLQRLLPRYGQAGQGLGGKGNSSMFVSRFL